MIILLVFTNKIIPIPKWIFGRNRGKENGELFQDAHPLCAPCSHSLFSIFPRSKVETWTSVYMCVFIIF